METYEVYWIVSMMATGVSLTLSIITVGVYLIYAIPFYRAVTRYFEEKGR